MKFFLPDGSPQGFQVLADKAKASGHRAIREFKYQHEGSKFVVIVGSPRREYKRKTGKRGGHLKTLEWEAMSQLVGNPVQLIIDTGYPRDYSTRYPIEVYSIPGDVWNFPSYVADRGIDLNSIEYFDW